MGATTLAYGKAPIGEPGIMPPGVESESEKEKEEMSKYQFIEKSRPVNGDRIGRIAFAEADKYIAKKLHEMKTELYDNVANDLRTWTDESLENVMSANFDYMEKLLLGDGYVPQDKKEAIENYLTGIGYTAEKFRAKVFEEHKAEIVEAMTDEVIYDHLQRAFDKYSFGGYSRDQMKKNYPQSSIINGFIMYMIGQKTTEDFIQLGLSKATQDAKIELERLHCEINRAKELLDSI